MARIRTHDEAVAAIVDRASYDRGFISNPFAGDEAARLGLQRTQAMLDRLGNPERRLTIVHVAGSKGKGSTCAYIDAILRATGRRTGRYLSPHLHAWEERFVADDRPATPEALIDLTARGIAAAGQVEAAQPELGRVTAFELTTAMALLHMHQAGCEIAVVEVGLGGTLDATNVVDPAVSVISRLDYEHTAILGDTMAEIASNKAGIIKPGRPAVSAAQPAEGMAVIEARARAVGSPLLVAERDFTATGTDRDFTASGPWGTFRGLATSLPGRHQVDNGSLAIAATHLIVPGLAEDEVRSGLLAARLPGRFEIVALAGGRTVVLDGAHTPVATEALAAALRDRFPDAEVTAVIGLLRDKHADAVLAPLAGLVDRWIAVAPASPRALPAAALASAIADIGGRVTIETGVARGLAAALRGSTGVILVSGSLATVAEARAALGLA